MYGDNDEFVLDREDLTPFEELEAKVAKNEELMLSSIQDIKDRLDQLEKLLAIVIFRVYGNDNPWWILDAHIFQEALSIGALQYYDGPYKTQAEAQKQFEMPTVMVVRKVDTSGPDHELYGPIHPHKREP